MKDYKKILEGVVNIINTAEKSDIGFANICSYIGENCLELKESEEETMKELIRNLITTNSYTPSSKEIYSIYGKCEEDAIAWLEKQGEQTFASNEEWCDFVRYFVKERTDHHTLIPSDDDIRKWGDIILTHARKVLGTQVEQDAS